MTKEQYQRIVIHSIDTTLQENYDRIGYSLLADVDEKDDLITMETKMIRNAIGLACQISLQLMGDMLEQAGIISFEEPLPDRRSHLRIVNPGKENPENPEK